MNFWMDFIEVKLIALKYFVLELMDCMCLIAWQENGQFMMNQLPGIIKIENNYNDIIQV